jgi:hypothetical protein
LNRVRSTFEASSAQAEPQIKMVDIGLAVTSLNVSILHEIYYSVGYSLLPYDHLDYRRSERVSAAACKDEPKRLAERLLASLFNAFSQGRINLFS